ncbi:papain-like cysteine protease family protein [Arsenicicoccus dermatophilus]|uniref:papain-like cysteine protease family protein n=1 Tax=Arsenicicoccus dermatophilus TaxID=1076331 RepID=UPI003916FB50
MSPRTSPLKALASAVAVAATLTVAPAATTVAQAAPLRPVAAPIVYDDGSSDLPIQAQAQQQTNWCWAATGTTIAAYKGRSVSQNDFCNLAFRRSRGSSCPNDQATLADDQTAFRALGITSGSYISGTLGFSGIQTEIKADRPILTRIQWSSGGGHMMVINGYDPNSGDIEWYNPWPSDQRINVGAYDYYVDNADFSWTHSLYRIGA